MQIKCGLAYLMCNLELNKRKKLEKLVNKQDVMLKKLEQKLEKLAKEVEKLKTKDRIASENGGFTLVMQNDGNLVIYENPDAPDEEPIWASDDHDSIISQNSLYALRMQDDGNLVIYENPNAPDEEPIWASR